MGDAVRICLKTIDRYLHSRRIARVGNDGVVVRQCGSVYLEGVVDALAVAVVREMIVENRAIRELGDAFVVAAAACCWLLRRRRVECSTYRLQDENPNKENDQIHSCLKCWLLVIGGVNGWVLSCHHSMKGWLEQKVVRALEEKEVLQ